MLHLSNDSVCELRPANALASERSSTDGQIARTAPASSRSTARVYSRINASTRSSSFDGDTTAAAAAGAATVGGPVAGAGTGEPVGKRPAPTGSTTGPG